MERGESATMVMDERRERIVSFINEEGSVTFSQLKQEFSDVSEMTLRTDLKALDEQHLIIRVHGGAKSVGFAVGTDDLLARRASRHSQEKVTIAQKAAKLVHAGRTIFIDSGSTTTALAAAIPDVELMVFTNSLSVAGELAGKERIITFVVGGKLNRFSMSTAGAQAIESVRTMTFDQVFLGVTGYVRHEGFSCGADDEAIFKKVLTERSNEAIALMDSSKEGRHATFRFCDLKNVDIVVSDGNLSSDFAAACKNAETKLL